MGVFIGLDMSLSKTAASVVDRDGVVEFPCQASHHAQL